jgi:hypothetical protein
MIQRAFLGFAAILMVACAPATKWHTVSPDHRSSVEVAEWQDRSCVRHAKWGRWCFDGVAVREVVFSPDSRHVAYPARFGERWTVVHDGEVGAMWDGVGPPVFSRAGGRLAYAVLDGSDWRVVADGAPGEPFDSLYAGSITFDPTGTRIAYAAGRDGWSYVVVDGEQGPRYGGIGKITFSPDGSRVAYAALEGDAAVIVVDHIARGQYQAIGEVEFSDVGGRMAYAIYRPDGWFVIDGETSLGPYASLDHLAYRPSDSLLTFVADVAGGQVVIAGGAPGPVFASVEPPVFSRTDKAWGYIGHDSAQSTVVVNGDVLRREAFAGSLAFSPEGNRLAYIASSGDDVVVVDDIGRHSFDLVIDGTLVFSRDGRVWGCLAGDRDRRRLFVTVEGVFDAPAFDWSEFMRIAWRKSLEPDSDAPSTDELRAWVSAELELVLEEHERQQG